MGSLVNRRVLVTRARTGQSQLAALLEAEGAEAILIPTIEIAPPVSWCGLDAALTTVRAYDWVIFTSANAVRSFAARARVLGLAAAPKRVAVVGPATAAAVEESLGMRAEVMPNEYVAEALVEALRPHAEGSAMLLVRAEVARDLLPEAMVAAGAQMTIATAYRNVIPAGSQVAIRELFTSQVPDAITFTSASTAENLADLLGAAVLKMPAGVVLASIGPVTSEAMRRLGWEPSVEADSATLSGLVAVLAGHFRGI